MKCEVNFTLRVQTDRGPEVADREVLVGVECFSGETV